MSYGPSGYFLETERDADGNPVRVMSLREASEFAAMRSEGDNPIVRIVHYESGLYARSYVNGVKVWDWNEE